MIVYYDPNRTYTIPRLHPYQPGDATQSGFVDFKSYPEQIPIVLEDFIPFADTPAIQAFYSFLKWINGPHSVLETNDCALRPPSGHHDDNSDHLLSINGRVVLMFRDLKLNTSQEHIEWLMARLMELLSMIDVDMPSSEGVVGFTLIPALHTSISNGIWHPDGNFESGDNDPGFGNHLMLTFWAYGDTESQIFYNLNRVYLNIWKSVENICQEITNANVSNSDA
jgi:hypothetical protein